MQLTRKYITLGSVEVLIFLGGGGEVERFSSTGPTAVVVDAMTLGGSGFVVATGAVAATEGGPGALAVMGAGGPGPEDTGKTTRCCCGGGGGACGGADDC